MTENLENQFEFLRVLYNCEFDQYDRIQKINKPFFTATEPIEKVLILQRIMDAYHITGQTRVYWEYKKMVASGVIQNTPMRKTRIIFEKAEQLKDAWTQWHSKNK